MTQTTWLRVGLMALGLVMAGAAGRALGAEPPVGAAAFAGEWELKIETGDGGVIEPSVELRWEGESASGDYTSSEDYTDLKEVAVEGGELRFLVETLHDLRPVKARFIGRAEGDAYTGRVEYESEGEKGSADVTGTRTKKPDWAVGLDAASAVGRWDIRLETPDGDVVEPALELAMKEGKLAGVYHTRSDLGTIEPDEVLIDGQRLVVRVSGQINDVSFSGAYVGRIEGDRYAGSASYRIGEETGSLPFEAKRAVLAAVAEKKPAVKPAPTPAPEKPEEVAGGNLVGTWTVSWEGRNGEKREQTVVVTLTEGKLAATLRDERFGEATAEEVKVEGNKVAMVVVRMREDRTIRTRYEGVVEGDTIKGELVAVFNDRERRRPFEGKRAAAQPAVAAVPGAGLVGKWELRVETPDGTVIEPVLNVTLEGERLAGLYEARIGELGEIKADKITLEGDRLVVNLSGDTGDVVFFIEYDGKAAGGVYEGKVSWEFGENEGSAPFKGKLASATATAAPAPAPAAVPAPAATPAPVPAPAAAAEAVKPAASPLAGVWELRVYSADGREVTRTIVVREREGKLALDYQSPLGNQRIEGLETDGEAIAFTVEADFEGRKMVSRYTGRLEAGRLTGKVAYEYGDEKGEVEFEGTRGE